MKEQKRKILIVDDEPRNIRVLEGHLIPMGFEILTALSGEQALQKVDSEHVDLILQDVMMRPPGMDGFEVCRKIKSTKWQTIPIILITALSDTQTKIQGLETGADDFLTKPIQREELIARVKAHLRIKVMMDEIKYWNDFLEAKVKERMRIIKEKNDQLAESYHLTLDALINALDVREHETGRHSLRVALYTIELTKAWQENKIHRKESEEIAMGALLHDVGKIGTPDQILLKPGTLTDEEWVEMRKHSEVGWRMIKDIEFLGKGRELVLSHHERYDGEGYPRGIKGEDIYIGARFFALADTMDAMTNDRPYRKALPFEAVEAELRRCQWSQFDPKVVELFFRVEPKRWVELKETAQNGSFKTLISMIKG